MVHIDDDYWQDIKDHIEVLEKKVEELQAKANIPEVNRKMPELKSVKYYCYDLFGNLYFTNDIQVASRYKRLPPLDKEFLQ